ncbi:MAG: hypothetical protein KC505_06740 [Myxococcales bacterium]|nr:hypothetical protein [Myxococcales bacterium]USN50263.1 MAG: hypothetical protein H6731_08320 [Myxococcales bacterium]
MRPKGKLRFHPYASKKTSPFKHMDGKRSSKGQRLYHCATPESFRAYYAKEPCPKNSSEDTLEKEEKNELYKMEVRFMLNKDE